MSRSASGSFGDFRSQVLAAIDIVELIGRSVSLKRRGRDYVGLCPFHQEKTPSFHVKPDRQLFYCFGCKAHGNAIDFVMQRDRSAFVDALNQLGEQAGIERPRGSASKEQAGEKQVILEANSLACSLFEKTLADDRQGQSARDYLRERGIDAGSVQRFQIGLAPDGWDGLLRSQLVRKFKPEQLALAGLVKRREGGSGFYDSFRNRLMFPIRDESARVIGFGGRQMPGGSDPKYLNSPETPLFAKSRCLFGIDAARQKIIETRTAVVVEGYTDVVMAHQFGAANVVAVLGTALTEQHVALLRRFADRIVLLFDADVAGDSAVDRAVGLFVSQPIEIAIAQIESGLDPDEFLLKEGVEAFDRLIASAPDALAYKWKQLVRRFAREDDSLTARQEAASAYLEVLSAARASGPVDSLRWGSAIARVSRLTSIPVEELNRRFAPVRPAPRRARPAQPAFQRPTARGAAELRVLGGLLLAPERWLRVQERLAPVDFADAMHRRLAEAYWLHQRDEGEPVLNEFVGTLADSELSELAFAAVMEAEAFGDVPATIAEGVDYLVRLREEAEQKGRIQDESDDIAFLRAVAERAGETSRRNENL